MSKIEIFWDIKQDNLQQGKEEGFHMSKPKRNLLSSISMAERLEKSACIKLENEDEVNEEEKHKVEIEYNDVVESVKLEEEEDGEKDSLEENVLNNQDIKVSYIDTFESIPHLPHSTNEKAIKKYKCSRCQYETNFQRSLKSHVLTHTEELPFACDYCEYRGKIERHLQSHISQKHPDIKKDEEGFKCDLCNYTTTVSRRLTLHKYRKHRNEMNEETVQEKLHECTYCQFQSVMKSELNRHIRSHTDDRPFTCDVCDYRAKSKDRLRQHIAYTHTKENEKFKCELCPFRCGVARKLKLHTLTHQPQKPFVCEVCNKEIKSRFRFREHMIKHNAEEKPFKCNRCNFETFYKSSLRSHKMNVHEEDKPDKPYKCDQCEFRCTFASRLKVHMTVHTKDKQFKCIECPFQTVTRSILLKHFDSKHKQELMMKCDTV